MKKLVFSLLLAATAAAPALPTWATTPQTKTTASTTGKVIAMDREMFVKEVFDYTQNTNEWKFEGKKPAIIDFYATWCGPCRRVAPILKELAEQYKDQIVIYKVDTDKEKELSTAMGIQSLPTILFIPMNGQPQVLVGAADKATFERAIREVLLAKPQP
ncbi:thioredoxin [gut metagenome]|uniref:Thioredoxin n=1 Tax=gut metagenome TaxID=749906 RepID=J9FSX9_9ZZZZ